MNDVAHILEPEQPELMERASVLADACQNTALRLALLESRQRWRQFGAIAADLLFEADLAGRLTFAAPDTVLGWPAQALLGQPGHGLRQDRAGPDPFCFTAPVRRRQTWMQTMQGAPVCMALTSVPLCDADGKHCGVRGVAVNVTAQEMAEAETASALRRGQALDRILEQMRQEVLARMAARLIPSEVRSWSAAS